MILSDGRELNIDMERVTVREYRSLFRPDQGEGEGDEIVGKAVGMTAEELGNLPLPDYRRIVAAFFAAAREPLADPNSASASTSA